MVISEHVSLGGRVCHCHKVHQTNCLTREGGFTELPTERLRCGCMCGRLGAGTLLPSCCRCRKSATEERQSTALRQMNSAQQPGRKAHSLPRTATLQKQWSIFYCFYSISGFKSDADTVGKKQDGKGPKVSLNWYSRAESTVWRQWESLFLRLINLSQMQDTTHWCRDRGLTRGKGQRKELRWSCLLRTLLTPEWARQNALRVSRL